MKSLYVGKLKTKTSKDALVNKARLSSVAVETHKNLIAYKGFISRPEFAPDDEVFVGRLLGIDDIVSFEADRASDLKARFVEAVDDYLAQCKALGKTPKKSFSGSIMARVSPHTHANAALAAELTGLSLNRFVEQALDAASEPLLAATERAG